MSSTNWAKIASPTNGDMQAHLAQLDNVKPLCRVTHESSISSDSEANHAKSETVMSSQDEEPQCDNGGEIRTNPYTRRRKGSASRFGSIDSEEESPEQLPELKIVISRQAEETVDSAPRPQEPRDITATVEPESPRQAEIIIANENELEANVKPDGPFLIHINVADLDEGHDNTEVPIHNVNVTASSTDHTALHRFAPAPAEPPSALRARNPWNVPAQSVLHHPQLCIRDCVNRCKNSTHYLQLDQALSQLIHLARLHKPSSPSTLGTYLSGSGIVDTINTLTEVFEQLLTNNSGNGQEEKEGERVSICLSLFAEFPRRQWTTLKCIARVFQWQFLLILKLVSAIRMCFEEMLQSGWESPERAKIRKPALFLQTHLRRVYTLYSNIAGEITAGIARDPTMASHVSLASPSFRVLFPVQMFAQKRQPSTTDRKEEDSVIEMKCFDWYWPFLCVRLQHECDYLHVLVHNPAKLIEEAHTFIKATTVATRRQLSPSTIPSFSWATIIYTVRVLTQWVRADPLRFPLLSTALQSLQIFRGKLTWHVPVAVIGALAELSFEGGPMGRKACLGRTSVDEGVALPPCKKQDAHDSLLSFRAFFGVYGIFDPGSHNHDVRCVVAECLCRLQHSPDPTIREACRAALVEMEAQELVRARNPKKTIAPLLSHRSNMDVSGMLLSMQGLRLGTDGSHFFFRAPRFAWVKKKKSGESSGGSSGSSSSGSSGSSSSSSSSSVSGSNNESSRGSGSSILLCWSSDDYGSVSRSCDGGNSDNGSSDCGRSHSGNENSHGDRREGGGSSSSSSSSGCSSSSSSRDSGNSESDNDDSSSGSGSSVSSSVSGSVSGSVSCSVSGSVSGSASGSDNYSSANNGDSCSSSSGSENASGRSRRPLKPILSLPQHESEGMSHSNSWWRAEPGQRKPKTVNWAQSVVDRDPTPSPPSQDNIEEEEPEGREHLEEHFESLLHESRV